MDTLLRFGKGMREYAFTPDNQINLASNFGDVVTSTSRMPGMSGGFNQYGNEPLPSEVGSINFSFWLYYDTPSEGVTARDAVLAMADWGMQKLFMLPQNDATQDERFCWAIVNNISANFNSQSLNHKRMRVTITFHAPDPFWYSAEPTVLEYYRSGALTISFNVGGSARTLPIVSYYTSKSGVVIGTAGVEVGDLDVLVGMGASGSSITNPWLERTESGVNTHRYDYTGAVSNGDNLVVDAQAETVEENSVNSWANITRTRAELMVFRPGTNVVRFNGTISGTVLLRFTYYETWR